MLHVQVLCCSNNFRSFGCSVAPCSRSVETDDTFADIEVQKNQTQTSTSEGKFDSDVAEASSSSGEVMSRGHHLRYGHTAVTCCVGSNLASAD